MKYTDEELLELWSEFVEIDFVMQDGTCYLDEPWNGFAKGAAERDVLGWFNARYSKGIVSLVEEQHTYA